MPTRRFFVIALPAIIAGTASAEDLSSMEKQLHDAANSNDATRIRALIAQGVRIDARDKALRTPLLVATRANAIDAARALIEAGADVNAKDNIRDTPFLYAGAEGRLEILRLCLKAGANLKDTNRYGGNALIPAAHHGHPETVAELLKTDIDVNHINRLGWTALLETVILSDGGPTHQKIMRLLIDAGADVNIADKDGVTPLGHARKMGFREMVKMLEAAGGR